MNLSDYSEHKPHRKKRIIWHIINVTLFRWLELQCFRGIRHALLRAFGATIDKDALIYASCKIYAPWNLKVGRACIGPRTEIYNKADIIIGNDSVISQDCFICTASHDISSTMLPLVVRPITIGNYAWIAARAYVGPGVNIGEGAVVGATASVYKDVEPWTVVGGNPAKTIKKRIIETNHAT